MDHEQHGRLPMTKRKRTTPRKRKYQNCDEHKVGTVCTLECKECGEKLDKLNALFTEALFGG